MLRATLAVLLMSMGVAHADSQEIVVGQVLSLTGPSAAIAAELERGRAACVAFLNEQGGVRGRKLKLVTRDDRGSPAQAVKLAQELAERDGAVLMFGSMGPSVNAAVLNWAAGERMPVVGPYGGEIENRVQGADTAFFLTANQSAEAERLAAHVAALGIKRVRVVYTDDESGRALLTAMEEGLTVAGVSVSASVPVKAGATLPSASLRQAIKSDSQAVLLATTGKTTTSLLRELTDNTSGVTQIYGLSSAASPVELESLGARARGFSMTEVIPLPRDSRLQVVRTFQRAMQGIPGERTYAELEGCLAPLFAAKVLGRSSGPITRTAILQAFRTSSKVDLGGFEVEPADKNKIGSRFTDIVYITSDGRIAH